MATIQMGLAAGTSYLFSTLDIHPHTQQNFNLVIKPVRGKLFSHSHPLLSPIFVIQMLTSDPCVVANLIVTVVISYWFVGIVILCMISFDIDFVRD